MEFWHIFLKFWFRIARYSIANRPKFQCILWKLTEIPWNNHFSTDFPWKFHGTNYIFPPKFHGTNFYFSRPSTGGFWKINGTCGMAHWNLWHSKLCVLTEALFYQLYDRWHSDVCFTLLCIKPTPIFMVTFYYAHNFYPLAGRDTLTFEVMNVLTFYNIIQP